MVPQDADDRKPTQREASELWRWQSRLLPFMVGLLITLTTLFSASNLFQVFVVQDYVRSAPTLDPSIFLRSAPAGRASADLKNGDVLAMLESYSLVRRYHQTSIILMARLYIVYLGCTMGMILAMVGAAFILAKYRESPSHADGTAGGMRVAIASSSPGLVLAALGTALMIVTITTRADVKVVDRPVWLSAASRPVDADPADALQEALRDTLSH